MGKVFLDANGVGARTDMRGGTRDLKAIVVLAIGAILLRLLIFVGRGDYIAFDEGWYLLLGRNLWAGDGYSLSGLRHVALSPLFPVLAGGLDRLIDSPVWAGRIVAAVTSGLLVVPVWSIVSRLAGRRTALLTCGLAAVMPSLAPFAAPYWMGWDLWVGAEPVLHLLLFSGIALVLRAVDRGGWWSWISAGVAFALAYLARPEAVLPFGITGLLLGAAAIAKRSPRRLAACALFGVAFALAAAPYWFYLHDALGRWALTGRAVQVSLPRLQNGSTGASSGGGNVVSNMLWEGRHGDYVRRLFALDASGTRLANSYWGISRGPVDEAPGDSLFAKAAGDTVAPVGSEGHGSTPDAREQAGRWREMEYYARALGIVIPWYLWPFVIAGILGRRQITYAEVLTAVPLVATSLAIAAVVAVDPRTQLFLAPLLTYYAARGIRLVGILAHRRGGRLPVSRGFIPAILSFSTVALLLGTDIWRAYIGARVGSVHQIVATENRLVGEVLRDIVPEGEAIMSWHPGFAIHARRDWRVLPLAGFREVVRYANAIRCRYIVLSSYYPSPLEPDALPAEHLILRIPEDFVETEKYRVEVDGVYEHHATAWLKAVQ